MGPQRASVDFPAEAPSASELAAEAERLSGMKIMVDAKGRDQAVVAFSEFPKGRIEVDRIGNQLSITDFSMVAPVLFRLLLKASVELGGRLQSGLPLPPIALPLSKGEVRRAAWQVHLASTAVSFLLLIALAGGAALLAGVLWLIWRHFA